MKNDYMCKMDLMEKEMEKWWSSKKKKIKGYVKDLLCEKKELDIKHSAA